MLPHPDDVRRGHPPGPLSHTGRRRDRGADSLSGVDESPASPAPEEPILHAGLRVRFRRALITGLVILVPVTLTAFILVKLFQWMDGIFAPVIDGVIGQRFPGVHIPGLGLLLTLLVILLLGWLSSNVVGRQFIHYTEKVICKIPVAKSIYSATKGVLEAVSHQQADAFKRVVLIEYPKARLYALAFVTNNAHWPGVADGTEDLLLVFVPTTPNPTSGFLLLVPRTEAIELSMTVEQGIRLVISGGILVPPPPERRPTRAARTVPQAPPAAPVSPTPPESMGTNSAPRV